MTSSFKSSLIFATATAIALTSFDLRPAAAAPEGGPAIAKQNTSDEFSSQRKRRRGRGVNPAVPLAAFGAIIGTIGAVAAAQQRRDYYERRYYDGPRPYYGGYAPQHHYGYAPQHYGYAPHPYAAPAPVYRQPHGYGGRGYSFQQGPSNGPAPQLQIDPAPGAGAN